MTYYYVEADEYIGLFSAKNRTILNNYIDSKLGLDFYKIKQVNISDDQILSELNSKQRKLILAETNKHGVYIINETFG